MKYEIKGGAFPIVVCQLTKGEQMIVDTGNVANAIRPYIPAGN